MWRSAACCSSFYKSYAVPNPEGHVASGRTELDILFHKQVALCEFFCEKDKKYYAAAGESGFHRVNRPV
jgi:hypothetical protein